jgi:hypothetical protein
MQVDRNHLGKQLRFPFVDPPARTRSPILDMATTPQATRPGTAPTPMPGMRRAVMKSGAGVTYTFDGAGQRVADSSPKLYWHGLNGSVLAETDTSDKCCPWQS